MSRFNLFFLLPLLACRGDAESGIDRTFIRGTVEIPPGAFTEAESGEGANDTYDTAEDLGYIGARYTTVQGTCARFGQSTGPVPTGEIDFFQFNPLDDATLTLTLSYEDVDIANADTGAIPDEETRYHVALYDLDDITLVFDDATQTKLPEPTLLVESLTDGAYGEFSLSFDATGGTNYGIAISGMKSGGSDSYTLSIDGFDPNEESFLVGVYQSGDVTARGNPLGGSNVPELVLDEETLTWSGDYEITYVYASTECDRGDQACVDAAGATSVYEYESASTDTADPFPTIAITANITEAYLYAGNFASLNAGLTAGTLYSAAPIQLTLSDAVDEDLPDGLIGTSSTNRVLDAEGVAVDTIQPKLYGWTEAEVEPNNFDDVGDGYTVSGTGAQALPEATGAGYVDVITGTFDYDGTGGWVGENDAFSITVPETLNAYMVASWADLNTNLDFHIYDSAGEIWGAGWYFADTNPESFLTSDLGLYLEPGETYYLALLPWSGDAGSFDYTIEIEWLAP